MSFPFGASKEVKKIKAKKRELKSKNLILLSALALLNY
jgi:hypothetical protein